MSEFEFLNAGNSEAQEKLAVSRLFAQVGTLAASGVLGGLVVTQNATPDGNVLIAQGSCVIHPTMTPGASLLVNDTQKTLNIFTANPMGGLPRRDIVVFDSLTASITAIIGTPAASPSDPTVPNTSLALARLRHDASAVTIPTTAIDSLIVNTAVRGTPIPVANQAARDALTATEGMQVYRLDLHCVETHNGTTWIGAPATYVPVLTAATTNPTNYTASLGRYVRSDKKVTVWFQITAAAGFTAGSGVYSISLPVPANVLGGATSGVARFFDSSTGNARLGVRVAVATSTTMSFQHTVTFGGSLQNSSAVGPWTWAVGDIIDGFITYEAA